MLPQHLAALLDRCESLYREGRYSDALAEINAFPELDRVEPPVVAMECRLCIAAGEWERGLSRAYLSEFANGDEYKIAAGEFYAAYASHLCQSGEVEKALHYIHEASKTFRGIRMQMLEDPGLARIFGTGEI